MTDDMNILERALAYLLHARHASEREIFRTLSLETGTDDPKRFLSALTVLSDRGLVERSVTPTRGDISAWQITREAFSHMHSAIVSPSARAISKRFGWEGARVLTLSTPLDTLDDPRSGRGVVHFVRCPQCSATDVERSSSYPVRGRVRWRCGECSSTWQEGLDVGIDSDRIALVQHARHLAAPPLDRTERARYRTKRPSHHRRSR